jgi:hypothetical protein
METSYSWQQELVELSNTPSRLYITKLTFSLIVISRNLKGSWKFHRRILFKWLYDDGFFSPKCLYLYQSKSQKWIYIVCRTIPICFRVSILDRSPAIWYSKISFVTSYNWPSKELTQIHLRCVLKRGSL